MTAYLIRRLGTSIVIVIGISIFIFILLRAWCGGKRKNSDSEARRWN